MLEPTNNLTERRAAARAAMEGGRHRERRLALERQNKAAAEAAKVQATQDAREKMAAEQKMEEERLFDLQTEEKAQRAAAAKLTEIRTSQQKIEELKNVTGNTLEPIRTLKTDLARAVRDRDLSLAKIAHAGSAARRAPGQPTLAARPATLTAPGILNRRANLLFSLSFLLFVTGAGLLGYAAWQRYQESPIIPASDPRPRLALIPVDKEDTLDLTNLAPREALGAIRAKLLTAEIANGQVLAVNFLAGGSNLTAPRFFNQLNIVLPERLAGTLKPNFLWGNYRSEGVASPFLLLVTGNYSDSSVGLSNWEARMPADLSPLALAREPLPEASASQFKTERRYNLDLRILGPNNGPPLLIYGFLNQDTILITPDESTFFEITRRFRS